MFVAVPKLWIDLDSHYCFVCEYAVVLLPFLEFTSHKYYVINVSDVPFCDAEDFSFYNRCTVPIS